MTAPRTYSGWKAGLLVVFAVVVLIALLNALGNVLRDEPRDPPGKIVTTVTPAPSP